MTIRHRMVDIDGVNIFYREAGSQLTPVLLLLHGFPSSSHQYVGLMERLADRFRVIAPDYPGFGYSDAPTPSSRGGKFVYSFDTLASIVESFCQQLQLKRFFVYMFDYGGPIGMRLFERHRDWIAGLIIQNANAYEQGLSTEAAALVKLRTDMPGAAERVEGLLTLEMTRFQYVHGVQDLERVAPDSWTLDQHFLDLPGRKPIQIELALDYHSNLARYERWQALLREQQPPTLILWGRYDPFFPEPGAHAYLNDLPHARLQLFETGHFVIEEYVNDVATFIKEFLAC
jgi:pimeloyl-ACP methyl ester carboxylesterase